MRFQKHFIQNVKIVLQIMAFDGNTTRHMSVTFLLGVTRAIMGTGEQQKLQRLAELEVRIKDLDVGVKSSQSETAGFIQSVNQQLEQFEWMKNREIGLFLSLSLIQYWWVSGDSLNLNDSRSKVQRVL